MRLQDKVIIVTGGGVGIGKAYSERLAAEGARVAIADIAAEASEALAASITSGGGQAIALATDVSDESSVAAMVQRVLDRFGRVDVLVNNAGLFAAVRHSPVTEITVPEWDRVMAVNVRGIFLCCRAVVPPMQAQGAGKIINISSSTVMNGSPGFLHYVTSKGAVIALTRALAQEVGQWGITVNALAPGLTASDTALAVLPRERFESRVGRRAIKRVQVPEDLTGTIVYLASSDSDFLTGQTILVDGGGNML